VTGAVVYGPESEQANFPLACEHWLHDKQEVVPGLIAYELHGSKTHGELALVLEQSTLITGDLIRSNMGGELCLLPDAKLTDVAKAKQSVQRMAAMSNIKTVLVGDGWLLFNQGGEALKVLASSL
jgi:Metallo-beta-lactamase superfamily